MRCGNLNVELRGDCYQMMLVVHHESVIAGPRDTGKSVACCCKLHAYATVPSAKLMVARKVRKSMPATILPTLERVVRDCGVQRYGGLNPERYLYQNGAAIWVVGLDDPGKALSGEWDAIYVCQAEELDEGAWETLSACCSGRGAVVANPQIFGDCNPASPHHWILRRAKEGKLRLLKSRHQDNPELYTQAGELTGEGVKRLKVLADYTGVRRKRMYEGEWVAAEGAVFEFSRTGHLTQDENGAQRMVGPHVVAGVDPRTMKRWLLAVDEGFTNPAVVLLVGADSDGRWHVFREFHKAGVLQHIVVATVKEWSLGPWALLGVARTPQEVEAKLPEPQCELAAVDEAAAGLIADLRDAGVNAKPGKGRVLDGIQHLQNRLACAKDGRPRLTFDPSCEETLNEMESYRWKPDRPKDEPVKECDHAPDALRYLDNVLAEPDGAWTAEAVAGASIGGGVQGLGTPRQFTPRQFTPRPTETRRGG